MTLILKSKDGKVRYWQGVTKNKKKKKTFAITGTFSEAMEKRIDYDLANLVALYQKGKY